MKNSIELDLLGKTLAKDFITFNKPLQTGLEKIAVQQNLTRDEIRRVAETANIETYLGIYDKSADKYIEFNLADANAAIAGLNKTASLEDNVSEDENSTGFEDIEDNTVSIFGVHQEEIKSSTREKLAEVEEAKFKVNRIQDEADILDLEFALKLDKVHHLLKQAALSGETFGDICVVIKTASENLGDMLINDIKKDLKNTAPFLDVEKVANFNEILAVYNDTPVFKSVLELENIYNKLEELQKEAEVAINNYNGLVDEDTESFGLTKIAGFATRVVNFVKKYPKTSMGLAAIPVAAGGIATGMIIQKNIDKGFLTNKLNEQSGARAAAIGNKISR